MKKLIALMFCLAVMATVARAEYPEPKANKEISTQVADKVTGSLRVVVLKIYAADNSAEQYSGKAVILGFSEDFTKVDLLLGTTLTEGIDLIEQNSNAPILGKITNGMIKTADATAFKDFRPVQVKRRNRPEMFYRATLPVGNLTGNNLSNAKQMPKIPAQQAEKLL